MAIVAHDSGLVPRLLELLAHENPHTRAAAVEGLWEIPATRCTQRQVLFAQITDVPFAEIVDRLVRAFKIETDPKVRGVIARRVELLHTGIGK